MSSAPSGSTRAFGGAASMGAMFDGGGGTSTSAFSGGAASSDSAFGGVAASDLDSTFSGDPTKTDQAQVQAVEQPQALAMDGSAEDLDMLLDGFE